MKLIPYVCTRVRVCEKVGLVNCARARRARNYFKCAVISKVSINDVVVLSIDGENRVCRDRGYNAMCHDAHVHYVVHTHVGVN